MATETIRLGPVITPLPRRHIAKLARETVSLDRLSNGRLMLGVGAGDADQPEYTAFGDCGDQKKRADQLDEGLDLLTALWSGKPVTHKGKFYEAETAGFAPLFNNHESQSGLQQGGPRRNPSDALPDGKESSPCIRVPGKAKASALKICAKPSIMWPSSAPTTTRTMLRTSA